MRISHEAIYTYLYVLPRGAFKRELVRYLHRRHRFRRPRKVRLSSRPIQDLISFDERPAEVADRIVPGHWEGGLLVGHANASARGGGLVHLVSLVCPVCLVRRTRET